MYFQLRGLPWANPVNRSIDAFGFGFRKLGFRDPIGILALAAGSESFANFSCHFVLLQCRRQFRRDAQRLFRGFAAAIDGFGALAALYEVGGLPRVGRQYTVGRQRVQAGDAAKRTHAVAAFQSVFGQDLLRPNRNPIGAGPPLAAKRQNELLPKIVSFRQLDDFF